LFADLAGFTRMSEAADPEEVRLMVDRCTSRMGEIVERYGGWIDKVIGDALMAVFGAPTAHEDDAERAVRAGLELQRYAAENADELGGLPLRVGVDSGEVMFAPVGPKEDRRLTVIGDAVNTASRLQGAAPEGGVLTGHQTKAACPAGIRFEAVDPFPVKGKERPVQTWLAREAAAPSRREVAPTGPILGREPELELLRGAWERVLGLGQPQLVSLLGSPGIGKTRLSQELVGIVAEQGGRVIKGMSLPYGENAGYGGFTRMVRSLAGILPADPAAEARGKLRRMVETLMDAGDAQNVVPHISLLAGFAEDSVENRSVLFISARDFLEAVAREQPTLFVFEDVHCADPTLLDLIEWVAAHMRNGPAMFLTLARGELLDARPSWGGGIPRYTGIVLEPLPSKDARELARDLLRDGSESETAAEQIEEAAGGNPLFIEELAAAMTEGSADAARELPLAVRSIIAARLDSLPTEERQLVLDASVAGNQFRRGMIERLGGDGMRVREALENLEFRDLIHRRLPSTPCEDDEYMFKHGLIRDVAYGTLPRAARRARHATAAEFLEETQSSGPDGAAILAHHWREAGDPERAVRYLLSAAEVAGRGWAKGEAVALCNEALELIPPEDAKRRREVELKRAMEFAAFTHIGDARSMQSAQKTGQTTERGP